MDKDMVFRKIVIFCLAVTSVLHVLTIYTVAEVIETKTGPVYGILSTWEFDRKRVQEFYIPYAEPPVGDLRFKKPVPKTPWTNYAKRFNANASHQSSNPAYNWVPESHVLKDEDCLYMHILVPYYATKDSKLAVMIWLHTGDFSSGTMWNTATNPEGSLAGLGDVIIVKVQYRLGILGFLWADTDEAPGNMGLFDVLEAMKWINNNIGVFGGDTDRITLVGHGAGGIIAGLMCMSPLAKGLFQRAILLAGSPAYPLNDNRWKNAELAQKVAKAVDCAPGTTNIMDNPKEVITCLRSKDAGLLVNVSAELNDDVVFGFSTILGGEFLATDPRPRLIYGNIHDVQVMVGHTQDEGSYLLAKTDLETFGAFGQKNPQINKTVAANYIRKALKGFSPELVVQHYLGHLKEDDYDAIREQAYHALGDFFIGCPDMYFAEQYARPYRKNKVYAYYFNHIPSVRRQWALWMGAGHLDDGSFLFGNLPSYRDGTKSTEAEENLSRRIIKLLTNFVKTGEPGENWQKFSKKQPNIMEFNISNRTSYLETHKKNCDFFRPLFDV